MRSTSSNPLRIAFASFVLGLAGTAPAKTIMWLGNFFTSNVLQQGDLGSVDSIIDWNVGAANMNGTYQKAGNLRLAKSTAYVDIVQTISAKITWWSQPNWDPTQFKEGRLRLAMYYSKSNGPTATPPFQNDRTETQEMNGQYGSMPNVIDSCLASVPGDTAWMYFGLGSFANPNSRPMCSDHNPYFKKIGTIHLLNPWPGQTAYAKFAGSWLTLYPELGMPGWVTRTFWADPTATVGSQILFANVDPTLAPAQYLNAGGFSATATNPFDFTAAANPWERWIAPPIDATSPKVLAAAPAKLRTLMILNPNWGAYSVRVTWKGVPGRFVAQATPYCNWFAMTLYQGLVPAGIVLNHPQRDSIFGLGGKIERTPADWTTFTNWIPLAQMAASGTDTAWLNSAGLVGTKPNTASIMNLCATKDLAFQVYDYTAQGSYLPFSEQYNTGWIRGLVLPALGTDGNVQSSGVSICGTTGTGAACTAPANGPGEWFKKRTDNATACYKQKLSLNAAGQYEYSQDGYFPLDTLIKDPVYNEKLSGKQSHDFGFCMHAKANFEYVQGLKFNFAGDDDVWVFIDRKLALDLGGQHAKLPGSIDLDRLGLMEGKAYQFDMFYCERHTPGSNISIQTTMNLIPSYNFFFDSAGTGPNKSLSLSMQNTTADPSKCPDETQPPIKSATPGYFFLRFPDGHTEAISNPSQFKGITFNADLSQISVNIDSIKTSTNLKQRGSYAVVARFQLDPSQTNTREIPFEITTGPVELVADLFDRDGDGKADSIVVQGINGTFSSPSFQSLTAVWAKGNGQRDSTLVAAAGVRTSALDSIATVAWTAVNTPFQKRSGCPAGGCVNMGQALTQPQPPKTVTNPIRTFREHIAPYADSARVVFGQGNDPDTLKIWLGEGVTKSGDYPTDPWAMIGRPSVPRGLTGVDASNPAPIQADGRLLRFVLPANHGILATDSLRAAGRVADSLGNSSKNSSVWVPILSEPVARGWMLDRNGDGQPDSVGLAIKGSLAGATSAKVHWRTATGADTVVAISTPGGISGGLTLPAGILGNATFSSTGSVDILVGSRLFTYPVADSVAPVAMTAAYRFGTTMDTLVVTASENLSKGSAAGEGSVSQRPAGSTDAAGTLVVGSGTPQGTTLRLVVAPGTFTGAMVRLRGQSLDAFGNAPGAVSKWVKVDYGVQPIRVVARDRNGDGKVDSIEVFLTRGSTGAPVPTGFSMEWNGETKSVVNLAKSADGLSWRGAIGPYASWTSVASGDEGWIQVGTDVASYRAAVEDSVAPVAVSAKLIFGFNQGDPDTIQVAGSEPLSRNGTSLVMLSKDSAGASVVSPLGQTQTVAGRDLRLVVPSGSVANDVAWARLGTSMSDGHAFVGVSSAWVRLRITPSGRAFLHDFDGDGRADSVSVQVRGILDARTARLHWKTADGKPSVRNWPARASVGDFSLHQTDLLAAFEQGATSCPGSDCEIEFLDSIGNGIAIWPLYDRVAPVALSGTYSFGTTSDTLVVRFSEAVRSSSSDPAWVEWAGVAGGSGAVRHARAFFSVDGVTATFVLDTANGARATWDSVRIALAKPSLVSDVETNSVGLRSAAGPIAYGLPPVVARVTDPQGLGRGTNVSIRLLRPVPPAALAAPQSFEITWNGETVAIPRADLAWDGTSTWSRALVRPFAAGVTECGKMCGGTARNATSSRPLSVEDGVAPALAKARYRYSLPEVGKDTLILELSEPWPGEATGNMVDAFATVGKPGGPIQVRNMLGWTLSDDRLTLQILVDSTWEDSISRGDSARLAYLAKGSRIWDEAGNKVGEKSPWLPIEFGLRPVQFLLRQEHAILSNGHGPTANSWDPPAPTVPALEFLVRKEGSKDWVTVDDKLQVGPGGVVEDGAAPKNELEHTMGLFIRLNRPVDGTLYLYDNIGTHVMQVDLSMLKKLWPEGGTQDDALREVKVVWNATGPSHRFVAGGIYLMRVVVKFDDPQGKPVFRNMLWKYAWQYDRKK